MRWRGKRSGMMVPVNAADEPVLEGQFCRYWVGAPAVGEPTDTRGALRITLDPPGYEWRRPKQPTVLDQVFDWFDRWVFGEPPSAKKVKPVYVEWVRLQDVQTGEPLTYYAIRSTLHADDSMELTLRYE